MAEYRRVEDILGAIVEREEIHGLVEPRHTPSAKYKKGPKDQFSRPMLRVGSRIVFPLGIPWWKRRAGVKDGIKGYGLGVVLDWEGDQSDISTWNSVTAIIQVVRVSREEFGDLVGHLRHIDIGGWHNQSVKFTPEECSGKDYGL